MFKKIKVKINKKLEAIIDKSGFFLLTIVIALVSFFTGIIMFRVTKLNMAQQRFFEGLNKIIVQSNIDKQDLTVLTTYTTPMQYLPIIIQVGMCVFLLTVSIYHIIKIHRILLTDVGYLKQRKKIKELQLEKYKLKLQAKLKSKPLKHSFLISLSTTIFVVFVFLGFVYFYWCFQDTFVIKPEFYGIQNDFCKLALIVLSKAPIIVFFIVGLMFCKRFFTWWDKYRDYLSLWEYHSRINDKDKQDDLLIALAPNYFGTKRNRRDDNNFMEKLLLKMIPTLNINAGGGSNNGNNGGQNGGQNP